MNLKGISLPLSPTASATPPISPRATPASWLVKPTQPYLGLCPCSSLCPELAPHLELQSQPDPCSDVAFLGRTSLAISVSRELRSSIKSSTAPTPA